MGHGASGVVLQRFLEAFDGLFVVVGIRPDQAAIEPELRVRRVGGDLPRIDVDVEVIHDPSLT